MPSYRMIMLSNAREGQEAAYERWYDDTHIPDMLKVPGFVAAQRFRIVRDVTGKTSFPFATIYEIEADSPEAALGAMGAAMASGEVRMSDTVDLTNSQGFICEAVADRVTRT